MQEQSPQKTGRPATGRKTEARNISLPPPLWQRIDEIAEARMMSRSALVRELIEKALEK